MKHPSYISALFIILLLPSVSVKAEVAAFESLQPVGKSRLSLFGMTIFDAEFKSKQPNTYPKGDYCLRLTYRQNFKASDIIKRSEQEMRHQKVPEANITRHIKNLNATLVNVKKNDSLTACHLSQKTVFTYYNGQKYAQIGTITDADFAEDFFNIWLGPKTSQKSLRKALLGEK